MSIVRLIMTSHHECVTSWCASQPCRGGAGRDVDALREARRSCRRAARNRSDLFEVLSPSGVRGRHGKDRDTDETTSEDAGVHGRHGLDRDTGETTSEDAGVRDRHGQDRDTGETTSEDAGVRGRHGKDRDAGETTSEDARPRPQLRKSSKGADFWSTLAAIARRRRSGAASPRLDTTGY